MTTHRRQQHHRRRRPGIQLTEPDSVSSVCPCPFPGLVLTEEDRIIPTKQVGFTASTEPSRLNAAFNSVTYLEHDSLFILGGVMCL